jgi:hypothetical protein
VAVVVQVQLDNRMVREHMEAVREHLEGTRLLQAVAATLVVVVVEIGMAATASAAAVVRV